MNALESRSDNAATKGIKMFLHRVSFYSTLLVRFEEYILEPLNKNFATADGNNPDLEGIKLNMNHLKVYLLLFIKFALNQGFVFLDVIISKKVLFKDSVKT